MDERFEDADGRQFLRRVRTGLDDLPTGVASTAWVWAALDLLLQTPSSSAVPVSLREYWETQQWLQQVHPELSAAPLIERLVPTQSSSVATFRISTADGVYVLAVQTEDPQASGTAWTHVRLPELSASQAYRLEEVITGEVFPSDPPWHYRGKYLRGDTDGSGSADHEER